MPHRKNDPVERDSTTQPTTPTRRDFLLRAGMLASGLSLMSLMPAPSVWADIPTNCALVPPSPLVRPTAFRTDATLSLRVRKSVWDLNAHEIQRLKDAYAALRQLHQTDPNDPRGWHQQANVHCFYCGGAPGNLTPEIHGGWWFFPWHRAYLYFHERILGKLVGDDSFALPYWDWNTIGHRTLPPPYAALNNIHDPLFDSNRGVTPTQALSNNQVGATVMNPIVNAPNFALIGGTDPDAPNPHGGNLEFGPHGLVHVWTADPTLDWNHPKPDMGLLQTAAQDPVFYTHHCNIDRLWDAWVKSSAAHTNPTDAKWLKGRWNFYDENKKWRSISVADVLNLETSLKYKYQPPQASPIVAHPPHAALPSTMIFLTPQKVTAQVEVARTPASQKIPLGTKPQTSKVTLPTDFRQRLMSIGGPAQKPRHYILHIEGIEVPTDQAAFVRVFVNKDDAAPETDVETPYFVGYFTVVGKSALASAHRHSPLNVALEISPELRARLKAEDDLSVTLVPVNGQDRSPASSNLTYKRIYITEEQ